MSFEYKVVSAPTKGVKAKGVKTPEARFALGIEQAINALAADGWEYQRSDVLPSEERQGLTGSATHWRTLLVFRRPFAEDDTIEDAVPERVEPVLTAPLATSEPADQAAMVEQEFEEGAEETRPT